MVIIEAPFQMHAGYVSDQIVIPKKHIDICTYDNHNHNIVRPTGNIDASTIESSGIVSDQLIAIVASSVGALLIACIIFAFYYYYFRVRRVSTKSTGEIDLSTFSNKETKLDIDITRITSNDDLIHQNSYIIEEKHVIFVDQSRV